MDGRQATRECYRVHPLVEVSKRLLEEDMGAIRSEAVAVPKPSEIVLLEPWFTRARARTHTHTSLRQQAPNSHN